MYGENPPHIEIGTRILLSILCDSPLLSEATYVLVFCFINTYTFVYLVVLGLSCLTRDLQSLLQLVESLVTARELLVEACWI